ncbi:hypothetical protein [Pseudooceanicola sp. MF1-13]|uniref:hypothetical protein n=1 Tax=Pseudooceanicola sp. MF1-13 TaxID=3379095 RepID=UPI003891F729
MARGIIIACGVIIFVCLLPVFGVAWSSWFAERHGCTLNEAGAHPCVVNGKDYGDLLAGAFVSGWFMLLTLPVAALTSIVLVLTLIIRWVRNRRTTRQQ